MKKRILSLLIVLAVLICVSVLTVSAANETRTQCECGGTAVGKYDHTCQNIEYLPWTSGTTLPASGNYYLTTDVTISASQIISNTLRLDLNGCSITRKVTTTADTQVFSITETGLLVITDSTDKPGTVTRDLSALTTTEAEGITNWGLLFYIAANSDTTTEITDALSLYNGIFDATGQYSGGGSVISNSGLYSNVNIYGGELKGGITKGIHGAIYSVGHINMFGGKLSGGVAYTTNAKSTGGVHITVTTGIGRYLTLSGDAEITGNYRTSDGVTFEEANTRIRWGQLYMKGNFTGCVSVTCVDSSQNVYSDPEIADWWTSHPFFYNGGANVNTLDISDGAILIDNKPNLGGVAKSGQIWLTEARNQCECGGKAEGKYAHTCKTLNFLPWTSTTSLPSDGNYYLTDTVTTTKRTDFGSDTTVRLDLNGNSIVRSVTTTTITSSIFGMTSTGASQLTITDSTSDVGTVTRDLSCLDAETQASIRNYGLLMFIQNLTGGGMTIYDGIYDLDGAYCDSASVIYNASTASTFNLYGGEIRCGITPTTKQGAIYSTGPIGLYGGKISGGKSVAANTAAVKLADNSNFLTISGDVEVTGNSLVSIAADGTITANSAANIFVNPDQLKIVGAFTGNIGITPVVNNVADAEPELNQIIGISDDADLSNATITVDGFQNFTVKVSGTNLVLTSAYSAITDHGMNTYYYDSLSEAIADYPGGQAVIRLVQDSSETVTITQNTYIDLNGCDIAGVAVNNGMTLYVYDSMTDDYTVEDGLGYGTIGTVAGSVEALPNGTAIARNGYLMITESDGTSFHCYTLQITAMTLRASCVGIYYQSNFGGDEVVKRNIAAYGVAMGAGIEPNFDDNTYTRFTDLSTWVTGTDADGNPKTLCNSTLLEGIMSQDNSEAVNAKYAKKQIYSVPYIELTNSTVIKGSTIHYSLKNLMEGYETFTGVDSRWDTLSSTQQEPVIDMYETYKTIVQTWDTPRIHATVFGTEIPDTPYEDDGVLKVLLIGHSLGLDSGFFFPEVYKEETGKDVVLGMLYHSGCPLYNHVSYLNSNAKQYAYYEFDTRKDTVWRRAYADGTFHTVYPGTGNDTLIENGTIGVTMQFGIKAADWDVVIMQAGVWEAAGKGSNATNATISANINTIREYVLAQDIEKRSTPEFAWNITWSAPSEESGLLNTSYKNNFTNYFNCDPTAMFNAISGVVQNAVIPNYGWKYILPSGTALHNGKTVMADTDLYRDTIHASDFSRLMIAYTWLCKFEGTSIDDYDITSIHYGLRYSATDRASQIDYELTDTEKTNLKKFVNAALTSPYVITDCSK